MEPHLLVARHLSKTFPGQVALNDIDISIAAGRTHALVGQNGSGKSTFIKVLAGYHQPDDGSEAELNGQPFTLGDGAAAHAAGIRFVHQDLGLVNILSAVENISMGVGYTTRRFGRIDWRSDTVRAKQGLASLGFGDVDVTVPVGMLAPSQRTAVALARALDGWQEKAHLLVLDEPTASLPGDDVGRLFEAIRILKAQGVAILYVSHHLDEVFEIADDVTIFRDGRRVTTIETSSVDHGGLIELMIGHRLEHAEHRSSVRVEGRARITVRGLAGGTLKGIDLEVRPGEIVGVAGITGSGREMLVPLITGQLPSDAGDVIVDGVALPNFDPAATIAAGVAFVPADRANLGVVPLASVTANLTLADVERNRRGGRLRHAEETTECVDWINRLSIKTAGPMVPIASLSGGNQQKVLFGRSLRLSPSVLILDEPTSGIDVAAKDQIMKLIDQAAVDGTAVLVVSTDSDELAQIAHRVVVMVAGSVSEEFSGTDLTTGHIDRALLATQKAGQ